MNARRDRVCLFENVWQTAFSNHVFLDYLVFRSVQKLLNFTSRLADMDTEIERIQLLQEKYGENFIDRNISRTLHNIQLLADTKKALDDDGDDHFEYSYPQHLLTIQQVRQRSHV